MKAQLEIACFDLPSALIAHQAGAHRIELCTDLAAGGTTPPWQMLVAAKEQIDTDIYVMIRPRGGDFCYDEEEFEQMKNDIVNLKMSGAMGFVFGILKDDATIDIERNKELVAFAHPFACTFHRAIDRCPNILEALEHVIAIGFSTVLTSGAAANVVDGQEMLKTMTAKAADRITIMPGGGLRASNIAQIKAHSAATFYHSSAIVDATMLPSLLEIEQLIQQL